MIDYKPSRRSAWWCALLPALIGLLVLAAAWPLFEAGMRLQQGERVLLGPIPTMEQRVERDFRTITDDEVAATAAARLYAYLTEVAVEEASAQPSQQPADDQRSPAQIAADEAAQLQSAVDALISDFRQSFAMFLQRYDYERSLMEQSAGAIDEEAEAESEAEAEEGGGGNIVSHMAGLLASLAEAPEGEQGLAQALIQQLELAVAPDPEADQDEETVVELSPADQAFQTLQQEWSLGRVTAHIMVLGLLSLLALFWSLRTVSKGPKAGRRLHRAYLALYGMCAVLMAAAMGIIPIYTRAHFGEGNSGWAIAMLGDLLYYTWPLLLLVVVAIISHVQALRARTLLALGVVEEGPGPGDRFLEHLRTGGSDPEYSTATRRSVLLHVLALIGPILLSLFPGCWGSDSYRLPSGTGEPAAAVMVQVVEEEQEKEELILAEDSPIIFERATIDDSDAMQQLVEQSKRTYEASGSGAAGAMGIGEGEEGGFMGEGGPIRFIYIRHRGEVSGHQKAAEERAYANFLRWLGRASSLETESRGEAMTIEQIYNRFPRGERPPFIYVTGDSFRLSDREREALRNLCLEGTLLFADAGSRRFHRDFTREMRRVFSDRQLIHINDEDPIMRIPNVFPNGLRSNQWHGPSRAMGIRHQRQLVVFYHPGDAKDMWKDDAIHIERDIRETALWIGQNVVYYSFRRYHERYGGGRR